MYSLEVNPPKRYSSSLTAARRSGSHWGCCVIQFLPWQGFAWGEQNPKGKYSRWIVTGKVFRSLDLYTHINRRIKTLKWHAAFKCSRMGITFHYNHTAIIQTAVHIKKVKIRTEASQMLRFMSILRKLNRTEAVQTRVYRMLLFYWKHLYKQLYLECHLQPLLLTSKLMSPFL